LPDDFHVRNRLDLADPHDLRPRGVKFSMQVIERTFICYQLIHLLKH
jgi:hypothetical protein